MTKNILPLQQVVVRAPLRIDFAGGPSDVPPFSKNEWGYVVNAAINRMATVRVRRRNDDQICIVSRDLGISETYESIDQLQTNTPLSLLTTAVKLIGVDQGIDLDVFTDSPHQSGLGASAAVSVTTLAALHFLRGREVHLGDLAEKAIFHEGAMLGNLTGGQDQFASIFGGFQSFHFSRGTVTRHNITLTPERAYALNNCLILCYTGTSHISGNVLSDVMRNYSENLNDAQKNLRKLREVAQLIEQEIVDGDLDEIGPLLSLAWETQSSLHPSLSTTSIEYILERARINGSTGGKVTGAGGGGCVLLACEPTKKNVLQAALSSEGIQVIPFNFINTGVTLVKHLTF